jgi:hypothetical protein
MLTCADALEGATARARAAAPTITAKEFFIAWLPFGETLTPKVLSLGELLKLQFTRSDDFD